MALRGVYYFTGSKNDPVAAVASVWQLANIKIGQSKYRPEAEDKDEAGLVRFDSLDLIYIFAVI